MLLKLEPFASGARAEKSSDVSNTERTKFDNGRGSLQRVIRHLVSLMFVLLVAVEAVNADPNLVSASKMTAASEIASRKVCLFEGMLIVADMIFF
mmetsp:Transcript_4052/g.7221  ORF Transcript_4052/g.7221 Transcript_4052/m.7221 type:complete len:95 (+) Transcript_4052:985-1269(+)